MTVSVAVSRRLRRSASTGAVLAVAAGLMAVPVQPALAAPGVGTALAAIQAVPGHQGLVPRTPRTDTPIISDGEIWDMEVVGNRVFIAGSFSSIANNGGATVAQRSLAAYNIDTGLVDMTFRPTFGGGGVNAVEASPDGSALYVAGSFDTVGGVAKRKVARLNLATGEPIAGFTANAGTQATALAVGVSAVYVGGTFGNVNGVSRTALAALNPTTGVVDPDFDLPLSGGIGVNAVLTVQQLKLTHDETKLLVVHTGRQIDGQNRYGVGLIDTVGKTLLPWRTRLWEDNLSFVGGVQRIYAGDIAPDDSYFVVSSGSGGDRPPINDTAIAYSIAGGDDVQPLWVSRHFDSVYSIAITEQAVYVGGHFSWEESPTAPIPWPGLDNVGYGNGQGLSGYSLGDMVVRRDHLGALDPATGNAVEWNPRSTSYEGVKALEATARGLFVGGDGMYQGGLRVGRVGFFDFNTQPAPSPVETTIVKPIEGRVVAADAPTVIEGSATAPNGVTRVQVQLQNRNSKQWLQDDLVTWGATNNTIEAAVANVGGTSTSWSLGLTLTGNNEYQILAKAFGGNSTSDPVKAVKTFESFGIADATPTTSISAPSSGLLATQTFVATGTASDDVGVNALTYWFRTGNGSYLQDDGTVSSTYNSFRGEPDVIGAPNATWQYEVNLPSEGEWTMGATAIDTAGQSDLRSATRDWLISADGVPPTVAIDSPVTMIPPTPVAGLVVQPGSPITFSGTAADEDDLTTVEISLRNTTTRESLAADGTWGQDSISGFHRISPQGIGAPTYDWSYTTPFNLTPGVYDFRVRATDSTGLTTTSANQGRLTITAQNANDAFPNGMLSFTGVDQNIEALHLDLAGTATDDLGVQSVRVSLRDLDTGRYIQPDGTMAASFATLQATLASPGATSTAFTLPVDLPTQGEFSIEAWAVDTSGQQDTSTIGATARYLVYPGDLDPGLSDTLGQPVDGTAFTESRIIVSGRALDDVSLSRVEVAIVNSLGQYMSSSGTFTSTTASWRAAFLNSPGTPGSNYSYTSPIIPNGTYTVMVRAVDGYGQVQQIPKSVTVTVTAPAGNVPPVANATVSCAQNVCDFDGRGSTDESPTTLSYSWDFGNTRTGTGPVPRHIYATPGTFTVTLTARDEFGATGVTTLTVTIAEPFTNAPPTAVFNPPFCSGLSCTVNGTGSTDPNIGDSIAYTWDFGDGTLVETGSQRTHVFAVAGTYTVTLTVTDGWGKFGTAAPRQVTATGPPPPNTAPTAVFTDSCNGLTCALDGRGSSDPDAGDGIASYSWNFGDGSPAGTGAQPSHTYTNPGIYSVTLTVRDNAGLAGVVTHEVTVTAPPQGDIAFRAAAERVGNLVNASVTVPASVAAGDTMVMYVSVNRSTTISNPTGWTVVGNQADGTDLQTRVWSREATASDAGTAVGVGFGARSKFALTLAAYSGVNQASPVGAVNSAAEATTRAQHTTPAVVAGPGSLLLSYWTDKSSATTGWTEPAGQSVRAEIAGSGSGRVSALLTDAPGGGGGLTATASSSSNRAVMWSIVLNRA